MRDQLLMPNKVQWPESEQLSDKMEQFDRKQRGRFININSSPQDNPLNGLLIAQWY